MAGPSDAALAKAASANRAKDKIRAILDKLSAENARLTKNVQDRQRALYNAQDSASIRQARADYQRTARVAEYSLKLMRGKLLSDAIAIAQSNGLSTREVPELSAIRNTKPGWV